MTWIPSAEHIFAGLETHLHLNNRSECVYCDMITYVKESSQLLRTLQLAEVGEMWRKNEPYLTTAQRMVLDALLYAAPPGGKP